MNNYRRELTDEKCNGRNFPAARRPYQVVRVTRVKMQSSDYLCEISSVLVLCVTLVYSTLQSLESVLWHRERHVGR
jgi:hypothetical protein